VQLRREGTRCLSAAGASLHRSSRSRATRTSRPRDLQKSLRNVGLATGKTFDRSVLEDVTGYLTDQYTAAAVRPVRSTQGREEPEPGEGQDRNQGRQARERSARSISWGNHTYKQKEVLDTFELKTPNWKSWYKQTTVIRAIPAGRPGEAAQLLHGRGYANFQIDSTQVASA